MRQRDFSKGATATVHNLKGKVFFTTAMVIFAAILGACGGTGGPTDGPAGSDPNAIAARVNGKEIRMEEVEKAIKAQAQGQELVFSPLELASARLTVLNQLIQTEVMYQKAEKEQTIPTEDDVTSEINKRKTSSGLSAEEFNRQMTAAGETEQSWRENVKKELALQKLQEKITGRVEAPKDSEIEAFFNGNREQFKNKRGVELGAIVIDPSNSGQGDTTTNDGEVQMRLKEIAQRLAQADFATVAREFSEDLQTQARGGDWRYFTEEELTQTFGAQVAEHFMNNMTNGSVFPNALPLQGRILVVKLLRKQEKDEDVNLDDPQVRPQITELLINARKNLLWQSYTSIALSEAKIENLLAKKVVENPNELSGARPASPNANVPVDANVNTNANSNTNGTSNTNAANSNTNADTNSSASNTDSNANTAANANN